MATVLYCSQYGKDSKLWIHIRGKADDGRVITLLYIGI